MELGGNAPLLVLEGADVERAVEGAVVAKMRNSGSACTAANRFYAHESLATEFTDTLERALGAPKVGSGLDPADDVGAGTRCSTSSARLKRRVALRPRLPRLLRRVPSFRRTSSVG